MKAVRNTPFVLFFALVCFGCEKEEIHPAQPEARLFGVSGIYNPDIPCGSTESTSVVDSLGTVLGEVEILNDANDLYVQVTMGTTRFLDEVKLFVGDATGLDNNGTALDLEGFSFHSMLSPAQGRYTFIYPIVDLGACADIVLWMRVSTRNQFGQVVHRRTAWLDGLPLYNIEKYKYCPYACP